MGRPKPPRAKTLNGWQYLGWHCCWCDAPIWQGARSAGRAEGREGAHDLSIEVYECGPHCPKRPAMTKPS
ncbi:hypothetical protein [Streptomyces venezuelae]|uniref:Uncharacterized protein n=1 Tax=Streptomyces venezuelae TaxID=54571 RepID=A0A5P2BM95_STRVZ|nr:hypothetical protein [Streptomyces venezuelae]QES31574.1 hypothetical protein DEJ47_17355 [Streptomyces venezuelae]